MHRDEIVGIIITVYARTGQPNRMPLYLGVRLVWPSLLYLAYFPSGRVCSFGHPARRKPSHVHKSCLVLLPFYLNRVVSVT